MYYDNIFTAWLVKPIGRQIFQNPRFAWWFLLVFGMLGLAGGIFGLMAFEPWYGKLFGGCLLVGYATGLVAMIYAWRSDNWYRYCTWSAELFADDE